MVPEFLIRSTRFVQKGTHAHLDYLQKKELCIDRGVAQTNLDAYGMDDGWSVVEVAARLNAPRGPRLRTWILKALEMAWDRELGFLHLY